MATATETAIELHKVRSEIAALKFKEAELADNLASEMTEDKLEVAGVGVFERRRQTSRKSWDHQGVFVDLQKKARDGELRKVDEATGEVVPEDPIELAFRVVREAANPSWRVTYLRSAGLNPDEYCSTTYGGYSIQIHGDLDREVV
jgi:hypothetical protein